MLFNASARHSCGGSGGRGQRHKLTGAVSPEDTGWSMTRLATLFIIIA